MEQLATMRKRSGGPTNNADAASALVVGTSMLLGLFARCRSGEGQYLETTMMCSNAYVVSDEFFDHDGRQPVSHHDEDGAGPLYRLYPCKSGWVFLAAPMPGDWEELVSALDAVGAPGSLGDDARFATAADRGEHAAELSAAIGAVLAERDAAEWERLLLPHDVACVEVSTKPLSEFTIDHAVMIENGFTAAVQHPLFGSHRRHGPIVTLSETPGRPGPACLVGEHTRTILSELGYSDDQIGDLHDRRIVGWPDAATG
jgi:crotonobetainyl-CoA:carnitine CoA-transferase CaiB-like acyl-CoA transferase